MKTGRSKLIGILVMITGIGLLSSSGSPAAAGGAQSLARSFVRNIISLSDRSLSSTEALAEPLFKEFGLSALEISWSELVTSAEWRVWTETEKRSAEDFRDRILSLTVCYDEIRLRRLFREYRPSTGEILEMNPSLLSTPAHETPSMEIPIDRAPSIGNIPLEIEKSYWFEMGGTWQKGFVDIDAATGELTVSFLSDGKTETLSFFEVSLQTSAVREAETVPAFLVEPTPVQMERFRYFFLSELLKINSELIPLASIAAREGRSRTSFYAVTDPTEGSVFFIERKISYSEEALVYYLRENPGKLVLFFEIKFLPNRRRPPHSSALHALSIRSVAIKPDGVTAYDVGHFRLEDLMRELILEYYRSNHIAVELVFDPAISKSSP